MKNVGVVIPSYNNEKTLFSAVKSICIPNYVARVVIIDDGSDMPVTSRLGEAFMARHDIDICILRNERNIGISLSLNRGIEKILQDSNIEFVARMDADDLSLEHRFDKQLEYLNENRDIDVLGGSAHVVDASGKYLYTLYEPVDHPSIRRKLNRHGAFIHPTLMVRRKVYERHLYDPAYDGLEDLEWAIRASDDFVFANLSEPLIHYTANPSGISQSRRRKQSLARARLLWRKGGWKSLERFSGVLQSIALAFIPHSFTRFVRRNIPSLNRF